MVISRRHLFSSRRIRFRIMAEHYFPCRIPMERTLISRLLFASRVKLRDGDNHMINKLRDGENQPSVGQQIPSKKRRDLRCRLGVSLYHPQTMEPF